MIKLLKTGGVHIEASRPFIQVHSASEPFMLVYEDCLAEAHMSGKLDVLQNAGEEGRVSLSACQDFIVLETAEAINLIDKSTHKLRALAKPESEMGIVHVSGSCVVFVNNAVHIRTGGKWKTLFRTHERSLFSTACVAHTSNFATGEAVKITRIGLSPGPLIELQTALVSFKEDLPIISLKKFKVPVDFDSAEFNVVAKYDREGSVIAAAINSSYIFYTQILIINPINGACSSYKLHTLLTQSDVPSNAGKSKLWVDDLDWSPSNEYLAIALSLGFFCVFHRGGQPFNILVSVPGYALDPNLLSIIPFATDPESHPERKYSVLWQEQLLLADGFSLILFQTEGLMRFNELAKILSADKETPEVAMGLSNLTKSLPTENEDTKAAAVQNILMMLRSSWSKVKNQSEEEGRRYMLSHIESLFHSSENQQEISYINIAEHTNSLDSAQFLNNIVVTKKISILEAFAFFCKMLQIKNWSLDLPIDFFESIVIIAERTLIYTLSDGQAVYAYLIIRLLEKTLGFSLHKLRAISLLYTVIQYKNHQASNMNIIYYPIAFKLKKDSVCRSIHSQDVGNLINFLRERLQATEGDCKDHKESLREKPEFYELSLNYLSGSPQLYSSKDVNLCVFLINGDMQAARYSLQHENLLIYAYFLDPSEKFFISPLEVPALTENKHRSISDLFNKLRALSSIPKAIDETYKQDSGFLYWVVGKFDKLPNLLGPPVALHAISSVFTKIGDKEEAFKAVKTMKKIFKEDVQAGLSLVNEDLADYFVHYGVKLTAKQLLAQLDSLKDFNENFPHKPFENLNVPSSVIPLLGTAFYLLSYFYMDLTRLTTKDWVKYKNTSHYELELVKSGKKLIRALWAVYSKCVYASTGDSAFLIRMAKFSKPSVGLKNEILGCVKSKTHLDIIAMVMPLPFIDSCLSEAEYLELKNVYEMEVNWKQDPVFSKFLYALFSTKEQQHQKVKKFLFPAQQVDSSPDHAVKTWNYIKRTLTQEYAIEEVLEFNKNKYQPRKNRSLNLATLFEKKGKKTKARKEPKMIVAEHSPLVPVRERATLECEIVRERFAGRKFLIHVACKELGHVLQKLLLEKFELIKDQIILGLKTAKRGHRSTFSMPSYPLEFTMKIKNPDLPFYLVDVSQQTVRKCELAIGPLGNFNDSQRFQIYRYQI